uniref:Uncharacterized protein n=1 Tax=Arundo donax TaxID=35708 RepID=A0A0A8Z978_ARUDO
MVVLSRGLMFLLAWSGWKLVQLSMCRVLSFIDSFSFCTRV